MLTNGWSWILTPPFALFVAASTLAGQQREVVAVEVVNLPETQRVEGQVEIPTPTPHARLARFAQVVVPPGSRAEPGDLVPGETIETAGFTGVVLSLQGTMSDGAFRPGRIGALLLPDEEPILEAFQEYADYLFALESSAVVAPRSSPHFASAQEWQSVGFTRYRVYFYNETSKSATVNLFIYLTH